MLPIAIGGSAANPVTIGHFKLMEWLLNSGKFSQVVWIISGDREDKKNLVDADHRIILTLLTFPQEWFLRKDVKFVISFEDVHTKNTPTIDWLKKMKKRYPDNKIVWYTGSDSVVAKPEYDNMSEIQAKWDGGDELVNDWDFLIFPRKSHGDISQIANFKKYEVADVELPQVSSSEVRRRIEAGEDFSDLVLPNAEKYIKQNGLYGYKEKSV